jgi:hypothetical protein
VEIGLWRAHETSLKPQAARDLPGRVGERLTRIAPGLVVMADRSEPVLDVVELACDHLLDVGGKRGIQTEDELAQQGHQWTVFARQRG